MILIEDALRCSSSSWRFSLSLAAAFSSLFASSSWHLYTEQSVEHGAEEMGCQPQAVIQQRGRTANSSFHDPHSGSSSSVSRTSKGYCLQHSRFQISGSRDRLSERELYSGKPRT